MRPIRAVAVLLSLATVALPATTPLPATTLLLVRHAEAGEGPVGDPSLTDAGRQRAAELAATLAAADLAAVYASQTRRAQETAAPAAAAHGLEVTVHPGRDLEGLVERVSAEHEGGTVLVVGHSNTVPALVGLLTGGEAPAQLAEDEHDALFVVFVPPGGGAEVVRLSYGER